MSKKEMGMQDLCGSHEHEGCKLELNLSFVIAGIETQLGISKGNKVGQHKTLAQHSGDGTSSSTHLQQRRC